MKARLLTVAVVSLLALTGGASQAAPTLPGSIAFSRADAASGGVFVMDRSGRVRRLAARGSDPAWSPEGRRVAYVARAEDGWTDMYVVDADGTHRGRITSSALLDEGSPAWAPDGKRLVVEREGSLVIVDADGFGERWLARGTDPAWSPDGGRIAFASDRGSTLDLYVVDASGGRVTTLTSTPGDEHAPAWSPDGQRLAFVSTEASPDLRVLQVNGRTVTSLTQDAAVESSPAWSSDGKTIAFVSDRTGVSTAWSLPATGGDALPLGPPSTLDGLSWRPKTTVELRPDFDQQPPRDLTFRTVRNGGRPRHLLGFTSSTDNRGEGPISISAFRLSQFASTMEATQRIRVVGGAIRTYPNIGFLRYTYARPHEHWHLMDFQRYELRRAEDYALLVRDRKSGFCLADHWTIPTGRIPRQPSGPRFMSNCGQRDTGALTIDQGTSVGYTDRYPSHFHGQNLDVTRVPAGTYVLVHRASPNLLLHEMRYENNAASLRVRLTWPHGRSRPPAVRVLETCPASDRCPS
ncbi:MAG: PD40 domain-containing protein [Actinobacteria bacterium]|nr:PD40 domain-containing protein [Actinomycetota bacterium]